MSSSHVDERQEEVFTELERNVCTLACHAGIEVDNMILGREQKLDAIKRLGAWISSSMALPEQTGSDEKSFLTLNPTTVFVRQSP